MELRITWTVSVEERYHKTVNLTALPESVQKVIALGVPLEALTATGTYDSEWAADYSDYLQAADDLQEWANEQEDETKYEDEVTDRDVTEVKAA